MQIDWDKITLIKDSKKFKGKNKIYKINYNNDYFRFKTPKCMIPFGIEKYANVYIVNLEFIIKNKKNISDDAIQKNIGRDIEKDIEKDISNKNINDKKKEIENNNEIISDHIDILKLIENAFNSLKNINSHKIIIPKECEDDINKASFTTSIKTSRISDDINKRFHHRCHVKKNCRIMADINKNDAYIIQLELDHLWIHETTYGLMWYVVEIMPFNISKKITYKNLNNENSNSKNSNSKNSENKSLPSNNIKSLVKFNFL